jgi:hypothetical protein
MGNECNQTQIDFCAESPVCNSLECMIFREKGSFRKHQEDSCELVKSITLYFPYSLLTLNLKFSETRGYL